MKQKVEGFEISANQHRIIVYGNGIGFSVFFPEVPTILKEKATEMIQNFWRDMTGEGQKGRKQVLNCALHRTFIWRIANMN